MEGSVGTPYLGITVNHGKKSLHWWWQRLSGGQGALLAVETANTFSELYKQ